MCAAAGSRAAGDGRRRHRRCHRADPGAVLRCRPRPARPVRRATRAPTATASSAAQVQQSCRTGQDANTRDDCRIVAVVNSVQDFWRQEFARRGAHVRATRRRFCSPTGSAPPAVPRPRRSGRSTARATGRSIWTWGSSTSCARSSARAAARSPQAYVVAHEYGHHVQDLMGTLSRSQDGRTGANSNAVKVELQADCYAGVWAHHATTTPDESTGRPLITSLTPSGHPGRARRGGGGRRRPDPGEVPGPGHPRVLDARLGRAAPAVVHHRLPQRRHGRLQHLPLSRSGPLSVAGARLRRRSQQRVKRSAKWGERHGRRIGRGSDDLSDDSVRRREGRDQDAHGGPSGSPRRRCTRARTARCCTRSCPAATAG